MDGIDLSQPEAPEGYPRRRRLGLTASLPLAVGLFVGAAGCDSLLIVEVPGQVEAGGLDNPALARTLVVGALGQFECSLTQYSLTTGLLANEYIAGSVFRPINIWGARLDATRQELGDCPPNRGSNVLGAFFGLQQARMMSEEAYRLISGFPDAEVPEKEQNLGRLMAYGAYAYTLLGEGFCEMTLDGGASQSPQSILQIAEERFTTAIGHATSAGDNDLLQMAHLGRARVRLNLRRPADAAQDAAQVTEGYIRYAQHSTVTGRRENRFWGANNLQHYVSVAPAYRNLEVGGVPDPRVPVQNMNRLGNDGFTQQWNQLKYPNANTWSPIASWKEAQLIIAEAGGGQIAVGAINRLRARVNLPLFSSNDEAEIMAQVVEERRRELFSEGHRLNDMLRLGIPFPSGETHTGEPYGPVTCMFLPDAEIRNNPNF